MNEGPPPYLRFGKKERRKECVREIEDPMRQTIQLIPGYKQIDLANKYFKR